MVDLEAFRELADIAGLVGELDDYVSQVIAEVRELRKRVAELRMELAQVQAKSDEGWGLATAYRSRVAELEQREADSEMARFKKTLVRKARTP